MLQVAAHSPSPFVELSQPSSFDNCTNMSLTQAASQLKQAGTVPGLGQLGAAGMKFKLSLKMFMLKWLNCSSVRKNPAPFTHWKGTFINFGPV